MTDEPVQVSSGSIVWAVVCDRRGYRKRRPAIVITPDFEISNDTPLVLMAITTTYPDPPPASHIELPWHADRRRVSRRCAAVLTWLDTAYLDEISEVIGHVPPRLLKEIRRRLAQDA